MRFFLHSRRELPGSREERTARFPIVARKSAFFLPEIAGENQGHASWAEYLGDYGVACLVIDHMRGDVMGVGKVAGKIVLFVC